MSDYMFNWGYREGKDFGLKEQNKRIAELEALLVESCKNINNLRRYLSDCTDSCGWASHSKSCRASSEADNQARSFLSKPEVKALLEKGEK